MVLSPPDLLTRQICRFAGWAGGGGWGASGRVARVVGVCVWGLERVGKGVVEGEGRPYGRWGGAGRG